MYYPVNNATTPKWYDIRPGCRMVHRRHVLPLLATPALSNKTLKQVAYWSSD